MLQNTLEQDSRQQTKVLKKEIETLNSLPFDPVSLCRLSIQSHHQVPRTNTHIQMRSLQNKQFVLFLPQDVLTTISLKVWNPYFFGFFWWIWTRVPSYVWDCLPVLLVCQPSLEVQTVPPLPSGLARLFHLWPQVDHRDPMGEKPENVSCFDQVHV